jgi:predicted nucleic acid-binding protein
MPSGKTSFVVFDTSIYIENFRTGRFTDRMVRSSMIPRCSAVVLHELLRGARARDEEAFVRALAKNCRILTPTENHWREAAELLRSVRRLKHYDGIKLAGLAFDALIALTARSIGATLITTNRGDFEAIRRALKFEVAYW